MAWKRRLTDEGNIDATWSERPTLRRPSQPVLLDPRVELIFGYLGEAEIGWRNSLQNIVVVLRRAEDAWGRVGHVPITHNFIGPKGGKNRSRRMPTMRHLRPAQSRT